ncbi:MAG: amino-acid N-acetyltransferase [Acidobacteria bacterium]|nr:amino-acid N-acetyltransferase [Acidobacteriota bacterium]
MKPTDLRGILEYIPRYRERIFVLSVDGAIVTDENFANILLDVAVLRSLNIRVALVHGAAAQIERLGAERGVAPSDLAGTGVTDAATLELALAAANRLTHEILEGLSAADLRAATTNAVIAHPAGIIHGVDQQFTGRVERVDVELLQALLAQGIIPVVPPLGFDGDGRTYRVNSDAAAAAVARALKAVKLVYITTHSGIVVDAELVRQLSVGDLEGLLQKNRAGFLPDSVSKAQQAAAACRAGVERVHVISGREEEGLLAEVFSNEGIGTMIHADQYEQIRPARKKDVHAIQVLIRPGVEAGELMYRSRTSLEKTLADFSIFEIDGNPVACVALHVDAGQKTGELACLYVNPAHEHQGIGRKLVQFVESRAREMGLTRVYALSTQAFTYFQSKGGFVEGTPDDLPPARREKYERSGRRSKVLVKRLA